MPSKGYEPTPKGYEPTPKDIESDSVVSVDVDHPIGPVIVKVTGLELRMILFTTILSALVSGLFVFVLMNVQDHTYDYLLKTPEDYKNDNMTTGRRRLNVLHHTNNHHTTCDDFKYGCCKVYYDCVLDKEHSLVIPITEKISHHNIVKINEEGTNCPTLKTLIMNHNNHYKANHSTTDSLYGSCMIDTSCDDSMRYRYMLGNNPEWIAEDYIEKQQNTEKYNIKVNRKTLETTLNDHKCPSVQSLINEYEYNYPMEYDPNDIYFEDVLVICFVGGFGCMVFVKIAKCINDCCDSCKTTYNNCDELP